MTAEEWNASHAVGTLVWVGPRNVATRTRSAAWRDEHGERVRVDGRLSPVDLAQVTPMPGGDG